MYTIKLNLVRLTCIPVLPSKTLVHGLLVYQKTQCLCQLDVCSSSISAFIILPHIISRQALFLTGGTFHITHTHVQQWKQQKRMPALLLYWLHNASEGAAHEKRKHGNITNMKKRIFCRPSRLVYTIFLNASIFHIYK